MSKFRFAVPFLALACLAILPGCERKLPRGEFLSRYEKECAVTMERYGFKVVMLYESPEYLAARLGDSTNGAGIESIRKEYAKANYVRISVRPMLRESGLDPGEEMLARQYLLGQQLQAAQFGLRSRIKLKARDGSVVEPIAVSVQKGISTGASNSIMVLFPKESGGRAVDMGEMELIIEDFGLNLGTLQTRLARPKGFRLKVAA